MSESNTTKSIYVVVDDNKLIGAYTDVVAAVEKLNSTHSATDTAPSHAIINVVDGKATDPHEVTHGGGKQGDGPGGGFNKFWYNWDSIKEMQAVAEAAVADGVYVVVDDNKCIGAYADVAAAVEKLNATHTSTDTAPSHAVIYVVGSMAVDPHAVIHESGFQGSGPDGGFNKFWYNWDSIKEMQAVAEEAVAGDVYVAISSNMNIGEKYPDVADAVDMLNSTHSATDKAPSHAVIRVVGGMAMDPHAVSYKGGVQGSGPDGGFNKFWYNWDSIKEMQKAAEEAVAA